MRQTIVELGRASALVAALALGTAVALAQNPASSDTKAAGDAAATTKANTDAATDAESTKTQAEAGTRTGTQSDTKAGATPRVRSNTKSDANPANPSRRDAAAGAEANARTNGDDTPGRTRRNQDSPRDGQRRTDAADGSEPADQPRSQRTQRDRAQTDREPGQDTEAREGNRRRDDRGMQRRELGIQFDDSVQDGIAIADIQEDSLAAEAGLKAGDRIVSVDGRDLRSLRQFRAYMGGQYGRPLPLVINRGGQRYTIELPPQQPAEEGAWLGVYLQDNEDGQKGATITNVYPAGPAARAGLRRGDVVMAVNGQAVEGTPDLIAMVDEFEPQSRVEFQVQRGDQQVKIPATLGRRDNFAFYQDRPQWNEDGGEPYEEDDEFSGIPPHAMTLEHDRRMAEQHERIETELRKLQQEVRQLREALQQQPRSN